MVPMENACEECTQHCYLMHKKRRNPESLVATFCKVMMGDDYSKTLLLPPKFGFGVKKLVGKTTQLEDSNGEKWDVKFTRIDNRMAFKEGWDTFAINHGLQKGDLLVFHYIKKSHFVVLMYGLSGCPETRHLGFPHHPMKETKKSGNKLTVNGQSSSKVHAKCNNNSHESSSKCEPLIHLVNSMRTVDKKLKKAKMSSNENTTNAQHLVASSSRPVDKETDQRSKPPVKNAVPDYMYSTNPTPVKPLCLVDEDNGQEQDECRRNDLQPVVVEMELDGGQKNNVAASGAGSDKTEIKTIQKSVESDGGLKNNTAASDGGSDEAEINRIQKPVEFDGCPKNNVAASGGSADETEINRIRKPLESDGGLKNNVEGSGGGADETKIEKLREMLEKRIGMADKKRKESTVVQSEAAHSNSMHKRPRPANVPITPSNTLKRGPDNSASRLRSNPFTYTGISPKPMAKRMEPVKKEPTTNCGSSGLIKKEPTMNHGSGGLTRKEAAMNHGSGGLMRKEPATNHGYGGLIKREPKPEPVDFDEAPLSGSSNTSFSAIMSTYKYLELPSLVKLKSRVILLRNGADLWPVLYEIKFGLKALTQNWSVFAKGKGIKPGDKCDFVLESDPTSRFACNVFGVQVTRQ